MEENLKFIQNWFRDLIKKVSRLYLFFFIYLFIIIIIIFFFFFFFLQFQSFKFS